MTIKLEIICDRCEFESNNRFDFYNRHFSKFTSDGKESTIYVHLSKTCQHELSDAKKTPKLKLNLKAGHLVLGGNVLLANSVGMPDMSGICSTHDGIII